jgi:hypothetical protein
VTAVTRVYSETQLDAVRKLPGVRVNEFPLGLEDLFIALFGTEMKQGLMEDSQ